MSSFTASAAPAASAARIVLDGYVNNARVTAAIVVAANAGCTICKNILWGDLAAAADIARQNGEPDFICIGAGRNLTNPRGPTAIEGGNYDPTARSYAEATTDAVPTAGAGADADADPELPEQIVAFLALLNTHVESRPTASGWSGTVAAAMDQFPAARDWFVRNLAEKSHRMVFVAPDREAATMLASVVTASGYETRVEDMRHLAPCNITIDGVSYPVVLEVSIGMGDVIIYLHFIGRPDLNRATPIGKFGCKGMSLEKARTCLSAISAFIHALPIDGEVPRIVATNAIGYSTNAVGDLATCDFAPAEGAAVFSVPAADLLRQALAERNDLAITILPRKAGSFSSSTWPHRINPEPEVGEVLAGDFGTGSIKLKVIGTKNEIRIEYDSAALIASLPQLDAYAHAQAAATSPSESA